MAAGCAEDSIGGTGKQSRRVHSGRGSGRLTLKTTSQNSIQADSNPALAPIRVAVIIGSKLERLGWSIVVDGQPDMEIVGQYASLGAALGQLDDARVDVALVDETMLTPKASESLRRHTTTGRPRFLMMTRHPVEWSEVEARYPFVRRPLLKGLAAADLLAAIREASAGTAGA